MKIAVTYVSSVVICHMFIDSSQFGINNQAPKSYLHKEFTVLPYKTFQRILQTYMLSSLIYHNKIATSVLMDDISNMKCQLHHLHFEEYLIQQKKETIAMFLLAFMC